MNTQKAGFSLVECIIYCAVLILIGMLVMNFVTSLQKNVVTQGARANRAIELYAALDVLVRDVQNMRGGLKRKESSWCAWQRDDVEDVGWAHEAGRLVRMQGKYDVKRGWQSLTKNNALAGVAQFTLEPVYRTDKQSGAQRIVGMQIMVTTREGVQEKQFVAVYEQELV